MKKLNLVLIVASFIAAFAQNFMKTQTESKSPKSNRIAVVPPTLNCRTSIIGASLDTIFVTLDSLVTSTEIGVTYKIRRLPTDYFRSKDTILRDTIAFGCIDAGRTIMVQVTATNSSGETNTCMTTVMIQDKAAPQINSRLRNITVSCQFPLNTAKLDTLGSYVVLGTPPITNTIETQTISDGIITDFCNPITITKSFVDSRRCGTGNIVRKFVFRDRFGNSDSITQIVTVANLRSPFTNDSIIWPRDTTIIGQAVCNRVTYPDSLGGVPRFLGASSCVMPQYGKTDMVFADPTSGCPYIMRTWKVYEMCTVTSNLSTGYFEQVQKIFIRDTIKPTITTFCKDTTFTNATGSCTVPVSLSIRALDNCTIARDIGYSYSVSNSSGVVRTGSGQTYTDVLSRGEFTITWRVDDRCGNISVCTYKIITKETKAPSPVALQSLVIGLPKACEIEVKAKDFERSSTDNCSSPSQLRFSFSANVNDTIRKFDCDDLGERVLDFVVTDAEGNSAMVRVKAIISDILNHCPSRSFASISGIVAMVDGEKVAEVGVTLEGAEQQRKVMTDGEGSFSMTNLERNVSYELSTKKEGDFLDGIDVLDILELQKLVIGSTKLKSAHQAIAADVDGNQKINVNDLYTLWNILVGTQVNDVNSPPWRVILNNDDKNINPWPLQESINYKDLQDNIELALTAIKIGDMNNSTGSNGDDDKKLSSRSRLNMYYDNVSLKKGEIIHIPIKLDQAIITNAQQLGLLFDNQKMEVMSVKQNDVALDRGVFINQRQGTIKLALADANGLKYQADKEFVLIEVLALQNADLSDAIMLSSEIPAFASTTEGQIVDLRLLPIRKNTILTVGQNAPNPFDEATNINFSLKEDMPVEVTIYDQNGKLVFRSYQQYAKGDQSMRITAEDLGNNSGVFVIHIECAEASEVRKMLRIR
jgi:hypothetical protein